LIQLSDIVNWKAELKLKLQLKKKEEHFLRALIMCKLKTTFVSEKSDKSTMEQSIFKRFIAIVNAIKNTEIFSLLFRVYDSQAK